MLFYRDRTSFQDPLDAAIQETEDALVHAGREVEGALERARRAQLDIDSLDAFINAVGDHIDHSSFAALPPLVGKLLSRYDMRHLTRGPWRGIFLLDASGTAVVALSFSKDPHDPYVQLMAFAERAVSKGWIVR